MALTGIEASDAIHEGLDDAYAGVVVSCAASPQAAGWTLGLNYFICARVEQDLPLIARAELRAPGRSAACFRVTCAAEVSRRFGIGRLPWPPSFAAVRPRTSLLGIRGRLAASAGKDRRHCARR